MVEKMATNISEWEVLGRIPRSRKVLCDIVEMGVFHLLLDHPWKYDLEAQNHGKINTYTIYSNNIWSDRIDGDVMMIQRTSDDLIIWWLVIAFALMSTNDLMFLVYCQA